ncbi:MAG: hypothetical protein V1934_06165 [Methanobacteriota archaeon]
MPVVVKYSLTDGTAYADMDDPTMLITKAMVVVGIAAMVGGLAAAIWYSKKK